MRTNGNREGGLVPKHKTANFYARKVEKEGRSHPLLSPHLFYSRLYLRLFRAPHPHVQ
jgi:hypothetical protein